MQWHYINRQLTRLLFSPFPNVTDKKKMSLKYKMGKVIQTSKLTKCSHKSETLYQLTSDDLHHLNHFDADTQTQDIE